MLKAPRFSRKEKCPNCGIETNLKHCRYKYCFWFQCKSCMAVGSVVFDINKRYFFIRS